MNKYQKQKAQAEQKAKDNQHNFNENIYTWQDLAEYSAYFEKLAKRYGLIKEFRENGIIQEGL